MASNLFLEPQRRRSYLSSYVSLLIPPEQTSPCPVNPPSPTPRSRTLWVNVSLPGPACEGPQGVWDLTLGEEAELGPG